MQRELLEAKANIRSKRKQQQMRRLVCVGDAETRYDRQRIFECFLKIILFYELS
jgi:hypothetical protein